MPRGCSRAVKRASVCTKRNSCFITSALATKRDTISSVEKPTDEQTDARFLCCLSRRRDSRDAVGVRFHVPDRTVCNKDHSITGLSTRFVSRNFKQPKAMKIADVYRSVDRSDDDRYSPTVSGARKRGPRCSENSRTVPTIVVRLLSLSDPVNIGSFDGR